MSVGCWKIYLEIHTQNHSHKNNNTNTIYHEWDEHNLQTVFMLGVVYGYKTIACV